MEISRRPLGELCDHLVNKTKSDVSAQSVMLVNKPTWGYENSVKQTFQNQTHQSMKIICVIICDILCSFFTLEKSMFISFPFCPIK